MKQTIKYAAAFFLSAAVAFAGTIKTWGTHDVLTAADLNANFQHIHNTMVGGHGPRLVDADVASNAAIGYSKLQRNPLTPTAWAVLNTPDCSPDGGACLIAASSGVTSITRTTPTTFNLTLASTGTGMTIAQGGYNASNVCTAQNPSANPSILVCSADPDGTGNLLRFVTFLQ